MMSFGCTLAGSAIGKTVFGGQDSNSSTIVRQFANFINAIFDGVWATVACIYGNVVTFDNTLTQGGPTI